MLVAVPWRTQARDGESEGSLLSSQAQNLCSLLSFLALETQAAGLIQKPLEAFVVIALVEMLLRSGTHKLKGMLGTPAAG